MLNLNTEAKDIARTMLRIGEGEHIGDGELGEKQWTGKRFKRKTKDGPACTARGVKVGLISIQLCSIENPEITKEHKEPGANTEQDQF